MNTHKKIRLNNRKTTRGRKRQRIPMRKDKTTNKAISVMEHGQLAGDEKHRYVLVYKTIDHK